MPPMAQIERRETKTGGVRWTARVFVRRDEAGKRKFTTRTFPTENEAKAWARKMETRKDQGVLSEPSRENGRRSFRLIQGGVPPAENKRCRPCAVYRLYDTNDTLLYVGKSLNAEARITEHRRSKSWASQIERVEIEEWPSEEAALDAEAMAIQQESPVYNIKKAQTDTPRLIRRGHSLPPVQEILPKEYYSSDRTPPVFVSSGDFLFVATDEGRLLPVKAESVAHFLNWYRSEVDRLNEWVDELREHYSTNGRPRIA